MIDHTEYLDEYVDNIAQYVEPYATVRFFDNRFIKNLKTITKNTNYNELALFYNPSLLFDAADAKGAKDISGKENNASVTNTLNIFPSAFGSEITYMDEAIDEFSVNSTRLTSVPNLEIIEPYIFNYSRARWRVVNNKCVMTTNYTAHTGLFPDYALVDSGGSDGSVEVKIESAIPGQGIIFRYIDDNNFSMVRVRPIGAPAGLEIVQWENGIQQQDAFSTYAVQGIIGSTFFLKIVFNNEKIQIGYKTVESNPYTFNNIDPQKISLNIKNRGNKHGLGVFTKGFNQKNYTTAVWDNLKVSSYLSDRGALYRPLRSSQRGNAATAPMKNFSWQSTYSFSFIINPVSLEASNGEILSFRDSSSNEQVSVKFQGASAIQLSILTLSGVSSFSANKPGGGSFIGEWAHITVVKNGSNISIYINGQQAFSASNAPQNGAYDASGFLRLFGSTSPDSFVGSIDGVALFQSALSDEQVVNLFNAALYTQRQYAIGSKFHSSLQIFNEVEGETHPFVNLSAKTNFNKSITFNNQYALLSPLDSPSYYSFFCSDVKSSSTAVGGEYLFEDPPFIQASFDPCVINNIQFATAFSFGKIKKFSVSIFDEDENDWFTFSDLIFESDIKILDLNQERKISKIEIEILSSYNPSDRARLFSASLWWNVDVSSDIISVDWSKIKENFESTMPIGSTSANNGSIVLNNTHQNYNPYNEDSKFYGYIKPELKASIALDYILDKETNLIERIPLATDVYLSEWNISAGDMTAELPLADMSTVFQEVTSDEGRVFEDVTAARACVLSTRDLGVLSSKSDAVDAYHQEVIRSEPVEFWRMNEYFNYSEPVLPGVFLMTIPSASRQNNASFVGASEFAGMSFSSILKSENTGADIDNDRSLANLYNITAESVGLQTPRRSRLVYTPERKPAPGGLSVGAGILVDHDSALNLSSNFSVEVLAQPYASPEDFGAIVSKYNPSNSTYNYNIFIEHLDSTVVIKARIFTDSGSGPVSTIVESDEYPKSEFLNKGHYIAFVKNGSSIMLRVDDRKYYQHNISGNLVLNNNPLTFFGRINANSSYSFPFIGKLSNCSIYDRALTEEEIQKHYASFEMDSLQEFNFLYFFDTTYWDGMLEIATADLGIFYFDEYNNFIYENKNSIFNKALTRYNNVQNIFDHKNIVSGDHVVDIEANKIVVNVAPKTRLTSNRSAIWRASDNESLAITALRSALSASDSSALVLNTENPIWPRSGLIKINNEIIRYNDRSFNEFLELERGLYNTPVQAHLEGALVREAKYFNIDFTEKPAYSVAFPLIIARDFENRIDVDIFESTSFSAKMLVSAADTASNSPESPETSLVMMEGAHPVTQMVYAASIAGIPFTQSGGEEQIAAEERPVAGVKTFKKKELTIDNRFIQSSSYARQIADFVIQFYGAPVPVINLNIIGRPFLQIGDRIKIGNFKDLNIINEEFIIIELSTTYDGGVSHNVKLKKVEEIVQ